MTNNLFGKLFSQLDVLEWDNRESSHSQLEALWTTNISDKELLKNSLYEYINDNSNEISEYSVETATHYKWHFYLDPQRRYRVWLHEYKDEKTRTKGYAETPHNHRYWFTSLIVRGGFTHKIFEVEQIDYEEQRFGNIQEIEQDWLDAGMVYTVNHQTIHALANLLDPTWTIVVQSKPVKQYSESFWPGDNIIRRHYPFSTKIPIFLRQISNL